MHRLVAAAAFAALVLLTGPAPAGAAPAAACKAGDLGCQLKAGLEGLSGAKGGSTTTTPTTKPAGSASVAAKGPVKGTASGSAATPATTTPTSDASLFGEAVPTVPLGGVLELPPLAVPDFGSPSPLSASVPRLARPARTLPSPVVSARPAGDGTDPARALGGALAAMTLVAVVALGLRRLSPAR